MKFTIGIVNFNRLFYLKSCVKSLLETTKDFPDVEFICIDDGSIESGTKEFLEFLKSINFKVIHQDQLRDSSKKVGLDNSSHIDPFSDALNIIHRNSNGDIIIPLQGDQQFVRSAWLTEIENLFNNKNDVGCVCIDAQRRSRLSSVNFTKTSINGFNYFFNPHGFIPGAGDVAYSKNMLDTIGGWNTNADTNAEDDFVRKVSVQYSGYFKRYFLSIPSAITIYTDKTGTNCRIRNNKRFGDYWQAKDDQYYKYVNNIPENISRPLSIEEMASPNGDWDMPINDNGDWIKNPIPINKDSCFTNI